MSKHTPRPWRTIESTNTTVRTVVGPDFPGQGYIADVNLCRINDAQDVDGEANASLIAAAPAMYGALLQVREMLLILADNAGDVPEWNTGGELYELAHTVRTALAQAEGKQ